MFAKSSQVRPRRIKRQLKAVASIAVALAAGAFLACQKQVEALRDAGQPKDVPDASAEGPVDANGVAIAVDASAGAMVPYTGPKRDAAVDLKEHRKGMPVPDNLLE